MKSYFRNIFVVVLILFMSNLSFGTLTITKNVDRQAASLGSNISYNIYLVNSGPADVTGVTVWDTIPFRSTYVNSTPSSVLSGSVYTWNPGTILAGAAYSMTLTVQVDADMNTITANIRNTASAESIEEGIIETMPVFTTIVKTFTESDNFVTYGAWEDRRNKKMGFIHIYALLDNTNINLYDTSTEMTSMANLVLTNNGLMAGTVIDYPNANAQLMDNQQGDNANGNGFVTTLIANDVATSSRYFKLVTNKPILWVFDSLVDNLWSDSFIYCMSTDYTFTGSTFYTHLYYDRNSDYLYHATDSHFGDGISVINTNNFDIGTYVYRSIDNGATWYLATSCTVKTESPVHAAGSAGGIWFYGGTTSSQEGDCKVIIRELDSSGNDVGDANGIVWKGNVFAGNGRPNDDNDRDADHDNNNAFCISKDGKKVSKIDSDVLYGTVCVSDDPNTGRGELVVTNTGAVAANFTVYKYRPNLSTFRDPIRDPATPGDYFGESGKWELWQTNLPLGVGASTTIYNGSAVANGQKEYYGSFIKIVLNSGGPIQAVGGANVLAAHYGQADYLEAVDTGIGVGTDFWFGNSIWAGSNDFYKLNKGGIFVALCPLEGTIVTITSGALVDYNTDGGLGLTPLTKGPTTGVDQALRFYSINTGQTYHITSNKKIFLMIQNLKGREKVFQSIGVAAQYFSPNPILSKSASSSAVNTGDNFTWTLNFFNNGAGSAKNVRIFDTLPVGVSFLSSIPTTSSIVGNYYTWDFSSVAPNSSAVIKMIVKATACGFNVTNTAATYYEDNINAPQPILFSQDSAITINCIPTATDTYTNTATPTVTLTATNTPTNTATPIIPQFTIVKAVVPSSAAIGETITYTISCVNTNNIALTNFEIWDTLPSQLENISNITSPGIYNSITGVISCLTAVPIGGSFDLVFTATLKDSVNRDEVIENMASANALSATAAVDSNKAKVTANVPLLQLKPVTNYPNPFDGETTIVYTLTVAAKCKITFYTISGEKIGEIINIAGQSGTNKQIWYGLNKSNKKLSSGVYIYRIDAVRTNEKQHCLSRLAIIR